MLSVVIATLNAASTLPIQLESLHSQRPGCGWEILVCDNGSQDGTEELVKQWTDRMPELRFIDASRRRGPAAARNIGVAVARAPWIAFCDADDQIADGWVATIMRELPSHPFIAGRFELNRLRGRSQFTVTWSPQVSGLTRLPYMPGFVTAGAGNMALRREVFDSIAGFDEGTLTAEDDDFCLRAQLAGFPLTFVPDMVLHVRRREGLLPIFRQAKSYGRGARRLEHRYALISAGRAAEGVAHVEGATEKTGSDRLPVDAQTPTPTPGPSQRLRRILRAFHPSRVANAVWNLGWKLGWRRADVTDTTQVVWSDFDRP